MTMSLSVEGPLDLLSEIASLRMGNVRSSAMRQQYSWTDTCIDSVLVIEYGIFRKYIYAELDRAVVAETNR
jgi:hypothetical protein